MSDTELAPPVGDATVASPVGDAEILGLRVQLTRAVSMLMQPTTERPGPATLAAALRDVVTASESALGRLTAPR